MTCNIIGLGETSTLWNGEGFSIGVNDCFRHQPTDALVVVNSFRKEQERYKIINDSRPAQGFYSSLSTWAHHPCYKPLNLRRFNKGIRSGTIYHAATSPFIAISLAVYLGYTEIVLYGVDFTNHRMVNGYRLKREVEAYLNYAKELEKLGVKVYLYQNYGAFKDLIPVYGRD